MKLSKTLMCTSALFLSFFAGPLLAIDIDVAPSTLNLAYQGEVVTVHTDIPYSAVVGASVTMNGIEIAWWKSDDRGFFVAKFNASEVTAKLGSSAGTTVTLMLTGTKTDGTTFSGTDTIRVINTSAKK